MRSSPEEYEGAWVGAHGISQAPLTPWVMICSTEQAE